MATDALTGRVGLVSGGTDWAAKLIRLVTRSPIHHVVIGLDDTYCISAEPDMVRRMPTAHYPHIEWLPAQGTPEQQRIIAWFATTLLGQPYNNRGFVLAGLDALGLIPNWARIALAEWGDRGYTCSQLVDVCHYAADIDLFEGPSVYTYPAELANLRAPVTT